MADTTTLVAGRHFTEDPRWHDGGDGRGDRLWYSDFYGHAVHSVGIDPDGRATDDVVEVALDDQPSGLGWLPDGRLLVVAMVGRQVLRREPDGSLVTHADLGDIATWWCNDMAVAPDGTAYVGHFGFDLDAYLAEHGEAGVLAEPGPPRAHVMRVTPDGDVSVAADDIRFPNGTVFADGGRTLIVAETMALRLLAFDIAADGTLSDRRVWADLSGHLVAPDGICIDSEGAVWAANPVGTHVVRVTEGGEVTDRVETRQNAFACALGGADGRTLFVCTAPDSNHERRAATAESAIEVVEVAVPA